MAQRVGGSRRKTRSKFRKSIRQKGKISLVRYFQNLKPNDKVVLHLEPAVQKGMYHTRYHSKTGVIKQKRGDCYEVIIKDGKKLKNLIIHPVHLKKCQKQK